MRWHISTPSRFAKMSALEGICGLETLCLDNRPNSPSADARSYSPMEGLSPSSVDNFNPDEMEVAYRAGHLLPIKKNL